MPDFFILHDLIQFGKGKKTYIPDSYKHIGGRLSQAMKSIADGFLSGFRLQRRNGRI